MKIYTRRGDFGETGLLGGPRVDKDALRIEVCGAVDELSSALGLARAAGLAADFDAVLGRLQHELFALGAEVGSPDPQTQGTRLLGPQHVAALEADIDRLDGGLPPLKEFILPGGSPAGAAVHFARAVCRRAERRLVSLVRSGEMIEPVLLAYVNRLGDLLFVAARAVNAAAGRAEETWRGAGK